jgi:hypothetical protein
MQATKRSESPSQRIVHGDPHLSSGKHGPEVEQRSLDRGCGEGADLIPMMRGQPVGEVEEDATAWGQVTVMNRDLEPSVTAPG